MKHLRPLEVMVVALLLSVAPLAAQCTPVFSFSVYNDGSVSADESTMYGYTSTEDTSTLCSCSHSGYTAVAAVYDPNGTLLGESDESGFSSSVSASIDGVSGNYQSSGAGVAFCSCLQGYFGGGGTVYPIALTCPLTISISSQQGSPLNTNNFPTWYTGIGMVATLTVAPGSNNGAIISENVTNGGTNGCAGIISQSSVCVGNDIFTVGPSNPKNASGYNYGDLYSGAGNNQFLDFHDSISPVDVLSGQSSTFSCQVPCTQTYSACGQEIGSFTLTYTYTHSTISGTPVSQTTASEQ